MPIPVTLSSMYGKDVEGDIPRLELMENAIPHATKNKPITYTNTLMQNLNTLLSLSFMSFYLFYFSSDG